MDHKMLSSSDMESVPYDDPEAQRLWAAAESRVQRMANAAATAKVQSQKLGQAQVVEALLAHPLLDWNEDWYGAEPTARG